MATPRIITLLVRRLRDLALDIEQDPNVADRRADIAVSLRAYANDLNAYDARETRKDPSKRKAPKRKK